MTEIVLHIDPSYINLSPFLSRLGFDEQGFIRLIDLSFDDLDRVMCWPYSVGERVRSDT